MSEWILSSSRESQERKGKIRTFTGKYVNPLKMRAADIDIRDIAHHLSNICRYTGACPQFYSVADHSILVYQAVASDHPGNYELQLAALLHDASEYVLNDIASPVKHADPMAWYRGLDHEVNRLVFAVFGIDPDKHWPVIKPYDDLLFRREATSWWGGAEPTVFPVTPTFAELKFLSHFNDLYNRLEHRSAA